MNRANAKFVALLEELDLGPFGLFKAIMDRRIPVRRGGQRGLPPPGGLGLAPPLGGRRPPKIYYIRPPKAAADPP